MTRTRNTRTRNTRTRNTRNTPLEIRVNVLTCNDWEIVL